MSKRYRLAQRGPHLWTSVLGAQMREEMEKDLASLEPGESMILDLDGIEAFNSSFANQFFGQAMLNLLSGI